MKEENMRPENLMRESDKLYLEDIKKFFSDTQNFKKVDCPACNSNFYRPEFKKGIFTFCRCKKCRTLFINPRPSQKQLADFYNKGKSIIFWSKRIFPVTEDVRMKNIFMPRAARIKQILESINFHKIELMVDVGAGYGSFLEAARALNMSKKYLAIEPARESAERCRERGFEVMEKMIEDITLTKKADLVVNFELMEHLFYPRSFIKYCHGLLKKEGLFIITTPNIEGFDLAILGKKSDNVAGPVHLNYFNLKSLSRMLVDEGFEILEHLTPGELDVDIIKNKIISGQFNEDSLPFWGSLIRADANGFNKKLQEFLKNNRLSSNMMFVCKK